MMRVLALDVGDKRIGIAVSDPLGITAQGLETYNRTGDIEKDAEYIANFAKNMFRYGFCSACRGIWTAAMVFKAKR